MPKWGPINSAACRITEQRATKCDRFSTCLKTLNLEYYASLRMTWGVHMSGASFSPNYDSRSRTIEAFRENRSYPRYIVVYKDQQSEYCDVTANKSRRHDLAWEHFWPLDKPTRQYKALCRAQWGQFHYKWVSRTWFERDTTSRYKP